jgi:hypothetical protein
MWSEFLATDPETWVQFLGLPDILRSSGSRTGFTQPCEYNWGATWKKKLRLQLRNPRIQLEGSVTLTMWHPVAEKVGTNLADKWWSLDRYNSCADSGQGVFYWITACGLSMEIKTTIVSSVAISMFNVCTSETWCQESHLRLSRQWSFIVQPSALWYSLMW